MNENKPLPLTSDTRKARQAVGFIQQFSAVAVVSWRLGARQRSNRTRKSYRKLPRARYGKASTSPLSVASYTMLRLAAAGEAKAQRYAAWR
jgi:hypothetical protein